MRAISDAQQTLAPPATQPIDLDGQQLDLRPVIQLREALGEKLAQLEDVILQSGESASFDLIQAALRNGQSGLKIRAAIEQHEELAVAEESKRLLRIIRRFGKAHPEHVDRRIEILQFQARPTVGHGMSAIGRNN